MIHHSPHIQAALDALVLAIASEVASDADAADAIVPVLHSELQPVVTALCNDLAARNDDAQGDDTNAHGFFDTYTTDAAW